MDSVLLSTSPPLSLHLNKGYALLPFQKPGAGASAQGQGKWVRTAGIVRGCIHVVEVKAAWLGHLQIDHIRGVLQRGHSFLMPHILQIGVVHLEEERPLG